MNFLGRSLIALVCVLLALPPGWCCVVGPMSCCAAPAKAVAESPANPDDCCCCKRPKADAPAERHPAPTPPRLCCCEPAPSATTEQSVPVEAPIAGDVLPVAVGISPVTAAILGRISHVPLAHPPRHLLFCVWRC